MRLTLCIATASSLALAGCASHRVVVSAPVPEVDVAVATGCVAQAGRPTPPDPLNKTIEAEDWMVRTASARAAAIQAQAGRRMNYEDTERAATSACQ